MARKVSLRKGEMFQFTARGEKRFGVVLGRGKQALMLSANNLGEVYDFSRGTIPPEAQPVSESEIRNLPNAVYLTLDAVVLATR